MTFFTSLRSSNLQFSTTCFPLPHCQGGRSMLMGAPRVGLAAVATKTKMWRNE
jgi:hypothetical protein